MAPEIDKNQIEQPRGRVRELLSKHSAEDPNMPNPHRERFLAQLSSRYGYGKEKAKDELERLLKQFYSMNKRIGVQPARSGFNRPRAGEWTDTG